MIVRNGRKRRAEELALVLAGAIGLGCMGLASCGDSGDGTTTGGGSAGRGGNSTGGTGGSSTGGAAGSSGGTGGSATGGSAGTSTGGAGGSGGSATGGSGGASGGSAGAGGSSTGGTAGKGGAAGTGGAGGATGGASGAAGSTAGSGGTGGTSSDGGTTNPDGGKGGTSSDAGGATDAPTTTDGGSSACTADPAAAANVAAIVDAANALKSKLTTTQQTAIQLDSTLTNARLWSNLPTTFVARNGVQLLDMSADAKTAALALVQVATSATGNTLFSELREADQWLVTNGGASANDYGDGRYFIAFIGAPSTSAKWMLQIAGHHLAYNFSYNTKCTGATPLFDGSEPMTWNNGGTMHAPLATQKNAMVAMLASLSAKTESKLTGTFSDILMGPGMQGDTKYPSALPYPTGTTGRGVLVGTLTQDQRNLVKTAIEAWVKNAGDPVVTSLLSQYESDDALNQTYVGYTGNADLSTQGSYVRIDGPRVWIEVTIQGGIIYKGVVHWHTIWRDKASDYGAEFK